jgi:CheY-like chemotaxis protein
MARLEGTTILWVDDRLELIAAARDVLQALGASVVEVRTNEEALAAAFGRHIDVVISDIARGPGDEDGTELGIRLWAAGVKAPLIHYVGQMRPDLPGPVGSFGVTDDDDELVSLVLLATGR